MGIKHIGTVGPYCVVEFAGREEEHIVVSFLTFVDAARYVTNKSAGRELDVMKLDADGYLTTEF
jgi:hypothetical protein